MKISRKFLIIQPCRSSYRSAHGLTKEDLELIGADAMLDDFETTDDNWDDRSIMVSKCKMFCKIEFLMLSKALTALQQGLELF